ncbi:MAG: ABC transporter permease [Acidobacteriota bacterium]
MTLDATLYAVLLRAVPDLGPYRADAVETYLDLRAEAAGRGWRALVGLFLRSAGLALGALLVAVWRAIRRVVTPSPRPPRRGHREPFEMFSHLVHDLRLALRSLRQRPGFSFAIVAMLALGIGSTTAVFSVVDQVLIQALPYEEPDRLVYFDEGSHPGPLVRMWREQLDSFETVAVAWDDQTRDLTGDGPPMQLTTVGVTADFLPLFEASAIHGRLLGPNDRTADRVAVLDAGLWQRRWGSDPSVVGSTVTLDGEPWTIVGVMSPTFVSPEAVVDRGVDLWVPIDADHEWLEEWGMQILSVVGRLAPGVERSTAQAELDTLAAQVATEQPIRVLENGEPRRTTIVDLHAATTEEASRPLLLLLGAVGLMLLIGCANVANLMLARGQERRQELALRSALGAGRGRLVGQLLTDALALSITGGLLGIGVAFAGIRIFESVRPSELPRLTDLTIDPRALGFALAVSLITGLLSGLAPAFRATRIRATRGLRTATGPGYGPRSLGGFLVVAEVAMALILLIGAGLFGHNLLKLLTTDPGFSPDGVVRVQVSLGEDFDRSGRVPFARRVLEEIEAIPGVESTAAGWTVPFDFTGGSRCCWRTGFRTAPDAGQIASFVHPVTPDYFATLGIPRRGRDLSWNDTGTEPIPAILNVAMAEALFGDQDPVGQPVRLGQNEPHQLVVVGVVEDTHHYGLDRDIGEAVYVPYAAFGGGIGPLSIVVRFASAFTPTSADALRQAVWAVDPHLPVAEIATLPRMISRSLGEPRFLSMLFGVFALLAALLAASGIASSLLYAVGRRRREMGIRMAVGARQSDLLALVVRQGMMLTGLGLLIGLVGSALLGRFLESLIYGLSPTDPTTFAVVTAALATVAFGASYWPARIAARTDPAITLRAE